MAVILDVETANRVDLEMLCNVRVVCRVLTHGF